MTEKADKMLKKMILSREQSVKHLFPSKNIQQLGFTDVVYSMKNLWIKVKINKKVVINRCVYHQTPLFMCCYFHFIFVMPFN